MNKKIIFTVVLTMVALGVGLSITQSASIHEKYSKIFTLDGTFYPDKKYVQITFSDNTKKNTSIILEILGMETSFQKTLVGPDFTIIVPFDAEPKYGWKTMPITLIVDHPEFGKIGIKTDIHEIGNSSSVIFTEL